MDRTEAIELLKNMHWSITTKMNREVPSSLALLMAIAALEGKDTNVPTNSALGHIHNVVRDDAYRRGYEQGKKDTKAEAIPVEWIEAEIKKLRSMDFDLAAMTAGQIEAMLTKWRGEQKNKGER